MKKMNKKGFTIVELTIVIAVIAILAAVLIPTFSGIVKKANQSAVQQEAAAIYKEAYALDLADGTLDAKDNSVDNGTITVNNKNNGTSATLSADGDFYYYVENNVAKFCYRNNGYTATFDGKEWKLGVVTSN